MNWSEVAIVVVCNLAACAFFYGRLTQQVEDHSRRIGSLEKWKEDVQKPAAYAATMR